MPVDVISLFDDLTFRAYRFGKKGFDLHFSIGAFGMHSMGTLCFWYIVTAYSYEKPFRITHITFIQFVRY